MEMNRRLMNKRDSVAEHLGAYVTPLPEQPADVTVPDALAQALASAHIVGLGEATHGTAEFTRLRHAVLQHLVTERGCRLLGLEANYTAALALDAYVTDDEGDPETALDQLNSWVWQTEELRDLLTWLREFNGGRPVDDRVRIRGFDAQYVEGPARAIQDFLVEVDPGFLEQVADNLAILADETVRGDRHNVAEEHVELAEETVSTLADRFASQADTYAARGSQASVDRARWHLRTMEGAVTFASESYSMDAPQGAVNRRDEWMAENVARLVANTEGPVVLWGHNGHLVPMTSVVDDASFTPLGRHLAERFGDDYRVVMTDFNRGSFTAIPDPLEVEDPQPTTFMVDSFHEDSPYADEAWVPERTVNGVLADHEAEACYLDVTGAAADSDLDEWLDQHHPVRDIGTAFWDESAHLTGYRLPEEVVGLLFVTESTPTTVLNRGDGNAG
ncbi:MAG: erythromycin esterase family protein [Halobacteriaceae archaeon]